jgi:hypothetical protein
MSRRGNCWDNAVAESFFATVKVELAHDAAWATRAHARGDVFEYIEQFYNGQRRHSALGYLSPITFERQWVREGGPPATVASQPVSGRSPENTSSVEAPGSTRTPGGRYLGIPPCARRDPRPHHPWSPRDCSADTGRNPSSVSPHPLTAVSTKPGQIQYAANHSSTFFKF